MKHLFVILLLNTVLLLNYGFKTSGRLYCNHSDSTYSLNGKIRGIDSGWVYVYHRQSEEPRIDSVQIMSGKFILSGWVAEPEFCNFGLLYKGKKDYYFGFFIQNGKLTLSADIDSLYDAAINITGSPVQEEFKNFQILAKPIDSADYQLYLTSNATKTKDDKVKMESLNRASEGLQKKRQQFIRSYASTNRGSYIAVFEVYSYFSGDQDAEQLSKMYKAMDSKIKTSYYGKKIKQRLMSLNRIGK